MGNQYDCIVIGAGISGLQAASKLKASGLEVLVLEKSRGVGGRMATRRFGGGVFDHGAQYFTVREEAFRKQVKQWMTEGIVQQWSEGFPAGPDRKDLDGHPRYRCSAGMTAIAKWLARDLVVYCESQVQSVAFTDDLWNVEISTGQAHSGRSVLLTPPVPQSLALLKAGSVEISAGQQKILEQIEYRPCVTLLAVLDGPSGLPEPGALHLRSEPIAWMADNSLKGISPGVPCLTIHGGPKFSVENWDRDEESVIEALWQGASEWVHSQPVETQLKKWRYAEPSCSFSKSFLLLEEPGPLAFSGDGFGGARIEGAAQSGLRAAEALRVALLK